MSDWISVKYAIPEYGSTVVYFERDKDGIETIGCSLVYPGWPKSKDITHWSPIPPKPKKKTEGVCAT